MKEKRYAITYDGIYSYICRVEYDRRSETTSQITYYIDPENDDEYINCDTFIKFSSAKKALVMYIQSNTDNWKHALNVAKALTVQFVGKSRDINL